MCQGLIQELRRWQESIQQPRIEVVSTSEQYSEMNQSRPTREPRRQGRKRAPRESNSCDGKQNKHTFFQKRFQEICKMMLPCLARIALPRPVLRVVAPQSSRWSCVVRVKWNTVHIVCGYGVAPARGVWGRRGREARCTPLLARGHTS